MLIRSLSIQGKNATDNRDCIATFKAGNIDFFLLMDGATDTPDSGAFVRRIRSEIRPRIECLDPELQSLEQANQHALQALKEIQCCLQREFIPNVTSLLLVLHREGYLHVNSWGDCLLGKVQENMSIQWLTQPHTLANVTGPKSILDIALDEQRHHLTRSFKARRYCPPDSYQIVLPETEKIILATDGFWACMRVADQQRLLAHPYETIKSVEDDLSLIVFKP